MKERDFKENFKTICEEEGNVKVTTKKGKSYVANGYQVGITKLYLFYSIRKVAYLKFDDIASVEKVE
jgi:hypothetical protein